MKTASLILCVLGFALCSCAKKPTPPSVEAAGEEVADGLSVPSVDLGGPPAVVAPADNDQSDGLSVPTIDIPAVE